MTAFAYTVADDGSAQPTAERIKLPVPDLDEAQRFLAILDPSTKPQDWHYRAIHPSNGAKKASSLYDLQAKNLGGYGAFLVINAGGNDAASITRIRGLYVDFDVVDEHLERLDLVPFEPSIIVESSPGKHHAYWLMDGVPLDAFTPAQLKLIALLGSDPNIKDLPRVMRLPGYLHTKGTPYKTNICHEGPRHDWAEFSDWLATLPEPCVASSGNGHAGTNSTPDDILQELLSGENVHANAMRIVARMVAKGFDNGAIRLVISNAAPHVAAARGAERASALMGRELDDLIASARVKFEPKVDAKQGFEEVSQAEGEPDQEEDQQPAPAFDNELPGRLADLQLAIFDRMRKPSALGAAMVALTVCGHLLGRRVLGPTNLGCNLQTIICAATGRGKDSLVGAPEWLMKPLGDDLQATIAGQFASRPALHEHLMQQPCTLASIDEVGHMLKAIGNPRDSHMHDLGGFIMELFSSASKTIIPRGRRKAKGVVDLEPVKHPHFSLVGATTPAMLGLALTSDMTAAGQLNRLLICCLDDWNGHRQKPRFNAAPGWWAGWANDLQANYPDPGLHGEPLKMSWTKDADAFFWSEEERRDDALEGQADMVQQLRRRDCEHALKIAQVVALADFKTEVTRSHLEWAFSFVDRLQWAVLDLCRAEGILQGSSLDAVAKTAADHLRKHGPKTEARLAADCRVFGATKSGDRAHVMRIMRESFGMTSNATGRTFKLAVR